MKFSIIVPVYNVEQYLPACLESILEQTYQDFEVICVNDASTDKSYDIIMKCAERNSKIKLFNNSQNKGVSFCRNRGIAEAKGDYILFVDSDDMLDQDALIKLYRVLLNNDVEVAYYNYRIKIESQIVKEKNLLPKEQKKFSEAIQTGQSLFMEMAKEGYYVDTVCGTLYKREFLSCHVIKFYEGIVHEDVLFAFTCALTASRAIFINEILYTYRKRDYSITTTTTELHLDSFIIVIGEIMAKWRSCQLENGMDQEIMHYINRYIPRLNRLCALFPNHNKLEVGTQADQFLYEVYKGAKRKHFRYVQLEESEIQLIRRYESIIVFGAGDVASELISCLKDNEIKIEAVAVSNKTINMEEIDNIHIYQIEELLCFKSTALIIIGVIKRNQQLIFHKLQELGYENILCINTDKVRV